MPAPTAATNRHRANRHPARAKNGALLLNQLGYIQPDPRGAELLFQIITEREERAPLGLGTKPQALCSRRTRTGQSARVRQPPKLGDQARVIGDLWSRTASSVVPQLAGDADQAGDEAVIVACAVHRPRQRGPLTRRII